MTNYKDIYIGHLIQQRVDECHMTYAEFARLIHCSRTNVYRLFECKSIDVERLLIISEVLHYDFIHKVYFPFLKVDRVIDTPCILLPYKHGALSLDGLPDDLLRQIEEALYKIASLNDNGSVSKCDV